MSNLSFSPNDYFKDCLNKSTCSECKIIEKELYQMDQSVVRQSALVKNTDSIKSIPVVVSNGSSTEIKHSEKKSSPLQIQPRIESVWHVNNIEDYNFNDRIKKPLSPIESVRESGTTDTTTNKSSVSSATASISTQKTEIDSTSFIILRDDDVDLSKEIMLHTTNGRNSNADIITTTTTATTTTASKPKKLESTNSRERCDDCCFCNPNLHASSTVTCNYCINLKSVPTTASTAAPAKPKSTPKTQEISTNTSSQLYETLSKTDHTHVRTKSKDSDTVSLKCTKTNSKVRRFIPEDSLNSYDNKENSSNATTKHINRPKCTNNNNNGESNNINLPKKPPAQSQQHQQNGAKETKTGGIRLPSPFTTSASSQSYDSTSSSQCSSVSSSPTNRSTKKCPALPVARWQQSSHNNNHHHSHNSNNNNNNNNNNNSNRSPTKIRASRYQEFYGTATTTATNNIENGTSNKQVVANKLNEENGVCHQQQQPTVTQNSGRQISFLFYIKYKVNPFIVVVNRRN